MLQCLLRQPGCCCTSGRDLRANDGRICTRRLASGGGGRGAPPVPPGWCPAAARGGRGRRALPPPRSILQKEGITRCLRHYGLLLAGGELCRLRHRLHHGQAVGGIERRQRHLCGPGVRQPG